MKITGLKPLELAPGVTALAVAGFEVTLDFIISNSITDIEYQEGQPRVDKDTYNHFIGTGHTGGPFHIKKMTVLRKGKRFSFVGFFLYRTVFELADYLAEFYFPISGTAVDSVIRRLKGKVPKKRVVSEIINIIENHPSRRSRYRMDDEQGSEAWFPCLKEREETHTLEADYFESGGQRMLLGSYPRGPRVWFWDSRRKPNGSGVPVYRFFIIGDRSEKVFSWDGEKIELRNFEGMEKDEFREFEKRGSIMNSKKIDPLPLPEMETVFFLRVPSLDEARALGEQPDKSVPSPRAQKPLFIYDLMRGLRVDPEIPVLDDPGEALGILSRTKDSIYIPGDSRYELKPRLHPEPYYLAAMKFRENNTD